MKHLDFLDEEINRPSVFTDESKLSPEFVPSRLLFRTKELKMLARYFRSIIEKKNQTRNMIIHGPVGTGKTSIAKKFGEWLTYREDNKQNKVQYLHINCRRHRTSYSILLSLAQKLNSHAPNRGYSASELLAIIVEVIEVKELSVLIVLDEIEFVRRDEVSNLLYDLTRTSDDKFKSRYSVGLLLISRKLEFLELLDESTCSTLSTANIELEPYTNPQLKDILEERIDLSFKPGAVTQEAINLTAEIASRTGDARQALEILWLAGKYTDQNESSTVIPEYVRKAKSNIEPGMVRAVLDILSTHKLLVCLAIARELKFNNTAFVTTGDVKHKYELICEEYKTEERKHTQFWEMIKELKEIGIISAELSGKGQRGTTQLITIHDIAAADFEKEVEKRLQGSMQA